MHRSQFSRQELRLEGERCVKYRGTARIRLEVLHFQLNEPRELSRKNVERLKGVFQTDQIRRLEPRNHIPAVVNQFDLNHAIQASNTSAERLLKNPENNPPMLNFPTGHLITCLHGRHRIQAAREILPPTDAWWTVDLYLTDTNPELSTTLIEEYSNEERPSDGEIYCKIRQYERERNLCFKNRWKALLSDHGRRGLKQLDDHEELAEAFDDVLEIPGMRSGMRLSTVHKFLGDKCHREGLYYLRGIRKKFIKLVRTKEALRRVDQITVQELETKAPWYAKRDARELQGKLQNGLIFSAFSLQEREAIWGELRTIDGLIPSLFTFFEDIKYLSACADCLKRLVKVSRRDTVYTALLQKFPYTNQAVNEYTLEVGENSFVDRPGPARNRVDLGYRQLWLSAMRHYRWMPRDSTKKKKVLLAKAGVKRADEKILSMFATLADRVGFKSNEIQVLKQRSSDMEIARNALLEARKPDRYQYDETTLEANAEQIVRLFTTAVPIPSDYSSPALVSENPDAAGNRCGFPDEDAQERDSKFLFITHLHNESDEEGETITSFFVRRSVYWAFFGKSVGLGIDNGPNFSQYPQHRPQRTGLSLSPGLEMDGIQLSGRQILDCELERGPAERLEQGCEERLEQEKLEQERLQRLEQERVEQEVVQQERVEQERLQRLEQERVEQERLQRLEQERVEQERLHRLEQERVEQVEQLEQERLQKLQQEQERVEQERLQKLQQERVEQVEQERLQRLEQERVEQVEQERLQRLEQERLEQERLEQERLEQETHDQALQDREKSLQNSEQVSKRHTQIDIESIATKNPVHDQTTKQQQQETLEQKKQSENPQEQKRQRKDTRKQVAQEEEAIMFDTPVDRGPEAAESTISKRRSLLQNQSTLGQTPDSFWITFKVRERGVWRTDQRLLVHSSDPSAVERMAIKYMRKAQQIRLYDTELNILVPKMCFQAAIANGRNMLLLFPEREIAINEELEASVSQMLAESNSQIEVNRE